MSANRSCSAYRAPVARAPAGRPRVARVVIALVAAVVLLPAGALAHQLLRASEPARDATIDAVPGDIRLTFSEPVRLQFTELTVAGPDGALALGPLRQAEGNPRVLVAPVEGGWHAGDFAVHWVTVGADGHRTEGRFSFTVAEDAAGLPDPEPAAPATPDTAAHAPGHETPHHDPRLFPESPGFGPGSAAYVAVRAALFIALLALIGALALRMVVLPLALQGRRGEVAPLEARLVTGSRRLGMGAAAALLVAAMARLWAQSASIFGPARALDPDSLAATLTFQPWATGWWLQGAAAVVAIAGLAVARRSPGPGWALAGVATLVAAVTPGLSGHAVASEGVVWLALPADALHVLAAGGWLGGLLATVVVGLPAVTRLEPGRRGAAAVALVRGFSLTAMVFAGILVATGLLASWIHLGEIGALWGSTYGRTLLVKLAIFAGVFLLGAYNLFRVRPALGDDAGTRRLRRSAVVELILALAVIVVTAVLVAVPPPAT